MWRKSVVAVNGNRQSGLPVYYWLPRSRGLKTSSNERVMVINASWKSAMARMGAMMYQMLSLEKIAPRTQANWIITLQLPVEIGTKPRTTYPACW